ELIPAIVKIGSTRLDAPLKVSTNGEHLMSLRDWFWVVLLGAIWGGSFLFNAILIREIGPLWVSAGRVTVGALGCWAYFAATGRKLPTERSGLYGRFLFLGLINYAAPFALFPLAEEHLPSGIVGVINAMT